MNEQVSNTDSLEPDPDKASGFRAWLRESISPFRIATLRGLAVLLPPLLTILLFAWAWSTIDSSIISPAESLSARLIAWRIADIRDNSDIKEALRDSANSGFRKNTVDGVETVFTDEGEPFVKVGKQWIPADVAAIVDEKPGEVAPTDARQYYIRYTELRYLERHVLLPVVLAIFLASMYLFGKLLAAGVGRMFWRFVESLINRLPIIRNVYSSVKQVTDFALNDQSAGNPSVQFNRVVAIEYPRKGIWSMGFVTGESMLDIQNAAGEPLLSILMPTSPMPATGFTVSVPQSQAVELDLTIDQAIQFCVSCGVVVPDHQNPKTLLESHVRKRSSQSAIPSTGLPKSAVSDYNDITPRS